MTSADVRLDHPGLLPAILVPHPDAGPDAGRLPRSARDWLVDVACFLLAVAVGLGIYAEDAARNDLPEWLMAADLFAGSLACLALWVRRRWPVGLAVALVPVAAFSAMAAGAALIAVFTVAVHRRSSVAMLVAALSLASVPPYYALHPDDDVPAFVTAALVLVVTVAVVAWGMFVRSRRQLVLSLRDRALRAEREQQLRVEQARQHERARIAREMHDVLAHRISLLSLHAGALEFRPDAPPGEIARAAAVIRESAHQGLQDLREVIGVLRDGADGDVPERPQPTLGDLAELIDESRGAGMHVTTDCAVDDLAAVPPAVGRNAYRIAQEGLTNARKHARGAAVAVRVSGAPGTGLTVEVRNRLPVGRAGEVQIPGAGTGIVGLAERAALAGGRLEHGRHDGDFRLTAWLPWPA